MSDLKTNPSALFDFVCLATRGLCFAIGIFGAFASFFVGVFSFGTAAAILSLAAGITPHSKLLSAKICLAFSMLGILMQVADLAHYLISLNIPGNYYPTTYFVMVVGALSFMSFASFKKSRVGPDAI